MMLNQETHKMSLQQEQQKSYQEKGFLLLPNFLCEQEIAAINAKLSSTSWTDVPGTVLEADGKTLRAIHEDSTLMGVLEDV
ncbi:MAG: hypothetical protein VKL59_02645 [Nostocaceae cyanobacterium]|nr:hypothetical protein [Nostocaceae cyanobacterium]